MLKTLFRGYWLYVACGLVMILPFAVLSFFAYPQADDFCVGSFVAEMGFADAQYFMFSNVNSRFVSSFLISVFVSNGITVYRIGILLVMLLYIFSVFVFASRVFGNKKQALLMSITFVLITFNLFPDPSEIIFWLSGAVTYLFPLSVMLLFASVCKIFSKESICNIKQFSIMLFLMLIIAGTHELALMTMLAVCAYILFFVKSDKKQKLMMLILILFGMAFLTLVVMFGASSSRTEYYEQIAPLQIVIMSATSFLKLIVLVFTSFPFLLSIFSVFLLANPSDKFSEVLRGRFILSLIYIFVALLLLISVPVIATSMVPPLRVYSFLLVILIPVVLLNVYVARVRFFSTFKFPRAHTLFLGRLLGILFIIALVSGFHKIPGGKFVITGNITAAISDVAFNAIPFSIEMNDRIELIEAAAISKQDTVVIPQLKHRPYNLFFLDINDDYPVWIRYCFQHYYNYQGVVVVE